MITQKEITEFGQRLATEFQPHRVVLFGSYACGQPTSDSDVDILVVMPLDGDPVDKSVEMRLKLRPRFPVDLLVRTPAKIKERLDIGDNFIQDILDKGKVLYEAFDD
ncbi:MAG: nucleotidyltransferase domain-containing protein [Kiritimatiellae bacterium]|nr:nucleotidyltransferase domain-containing protein [Kiritimatiellia bacterium]MDD3544947.1 nucleotidyltransferase domain-containing protein [Kiritimatiellia bacterium]